MFNPATTRSRRGGHPSRHATREPVTGSADAPLQSVCWKWRLFIQHLPGWLTCPMDISGAFWRNTTHDWASAVDLGHFARIRQDPVGDRCARSSTDA